MVVVPAKMGRINRRTLVARLQRVGLATRADLAKSLGMSQPTAGKIADELLALAILEEVTDRGDNGRTANNSPNGAAKLGRPGRMLRLDRTHTRFLGIELGVVETKLAPLPVGAQREDQWTTQVETPKSAEEWLASLQAPISRLRQDGLLGVLVSVPGIVDEPGGRVLFSPNLHWTEGVELPSMIRQVLDVPVVLVQEERALALGHQMFDPNNEDFLLVDFGDGVGGAIIVGGRLYANAVPISGELGHTPVIGNMRSCGCGAQGCVETLVSTRGLLQSYAAAHPDGRHSWADLVEHVNQAGVPGWLATALEATAVVIAGALNVLGLRRVIITGSLTELPPAVCQHLANAIGKGAMWARFGKVECQSAPRRRTAGLVAVGIDRLVMPMVGTVKATEEVLAG